ncbi:P-loop containing nucleoside triphosphate hydrolase protein [Coemansia reversa NRRL 1564]|uniref:P-loop containing nucleoside triphosphate hydrolase protein n=1 Tax=Coemansia reversa (strain ATCC 12441 / NRRL 1564) TaxID=763665 RepID=A0A2G5BJ00_COERN|nr:P-loop containing nucleoside triphosphate hydrolase protein [Coemansia reversa NRRL 1564]|eukprot:PIA18727.1 P-loop containing nucleoside triphosphate hydrolase protein [Coemansia reversa NRRL 1564]
MSNDSNSNDTDGEHAIGQATFKPSVHPFFKSLSTKRGNTLITNGNGITGVDIADVERKRPKQNTTAGRSVEKCTRRLNVATPAARKVATIQSFFATKSTALSSQMPLCLDRTIERQTIDVNQVTSEYDGDFRADTETDAIVELPRRTRPMFQPDGIPAPYPSGNSHIPVPIFESFISSNYSRAEGGPGLGRLNATCAPALLEAYAASQPHTSSDGGCTEWRQLVGNNYTQQQKEQQSRLRTPTLVSSNDAAPASLSTSIGEIMSHALPHLHFIERFLDALHNDTLSGDCCHTQLLTTRYRPLRARDVLGNRRAVIQLQSWIESMRLTRSMPSAAKNCSDSSACDSTIDARTQYGHLDTQNSRGRRHPTKARHRNRRGTHRLGNCTENGSIDYMDSTNNGHCISSNSDNGDSSDDFMPSTARIRRRARDIDGLRDVLEWAQSDGTLRNVREKTRRAPLHRRSGSESGTNSDVEQHSNIILLEGPSGSCKTAAVYACASECGFEVREIHPGERRSGKDVLAIFEDIISSHTIRTPAGTTLATDQATVNQVLILIEHVDVLFEQDQRLWPALKQLALKSRRPIVLTCNDISCVRWNAASFHLVLNFRRPDEHTLVPYCFLLCLVEGALVLPVDLACVCRNAGYDLNRVLNHLDYDLRQSRMQSLKDVDYASSADIQASITGLEDPQTADLGKILAWMCGPLGSDETPQTRYRFWLELVHSAQAAAGNKWHNCLPDPPTAYSAADELTPLQSSSGADSPTKALVANQNTFFGRDSRLSMIRSEVGILAQAADNQATVAPAAINETLIADAGNIVTSTMAPNNEDNMSSDLLRLQALSLREVTLRGVEGDLDSSSIFSANVETEDISDIAKLEKAAASLDLLSLTSMANRWSEYHDECLREPLHTFLSPMVDGCLDVDYILLDADTLTRNNPALIPDSIGTMQRTGTNINGFLVSTGEQRLRALVGAQSYDHKPDSSFTFWNSARPLNQEAPECNGSQELVLGLHEAIGLVGVMSWRLAAAGVAETAGYLSHMVRWDWIHQGKLKTPAQNTKTSNDNSDEHIYRIGTRRTRQHTYRAHIKHMPAVTQAHLVDWLHWWKHNQE